MDLDGLKQLDQWMHIPFMAVTYFERVESLVNVKCFLERKVSGHSFGFQMWYQILDQNILFGLDQKMLRN